VKIIRSIVLAAALAAVASLAHAQGRPSPKSAMLYIISPEDGETLKSPVTVRFGLHDMGVTHAGDDFINSGHHHLLIDVDEPLNPNEPIPADKNHQHFTAGQTEAVLDLEPGKHTLQLVLGDGKHFLFNPPVVSKKITITVGENLPAAPPRPRRRGSH
jgi:Domain of unknown function (DUF4399)